MYGLCNAVSMMFILAQAFVQLVPGNNVHFANFIMAGIGSFEITVMMKKDKILQVITPLKPLRTTTLKVT